MLPLTTASNPIMVMMIIIIMVNIIVIIIMVIIIIIVVIISVSISISTNISSSSHNWSEHYLQYTANDVFKSAHLSILQNARTVLKPVCRVVSSLGNIFESFSSETNFFGVTLSHLTFPFDKGLITGDSKVNWDRFSNIYMSSLRLLNWRVWRVKFGERWCLWESPLHKGASDMDLRWQRNSGFLYFSLFIL